MAYTNVWNDTLPNGAEAANTIDDLMRSMKVDIEQRFIDIFGTMPNFTADPLRPYGLKFTDAQDSIINLGDNAGTPRVLVIKNKAGSTSLVSFAHAVGSINVHNGGINIQAGGFVVQSGTTSVQALTCTTLNATGLTTLSDSITLNAAASCTINYTGGANLIISSVGNLFIRPSTASGILTLSDSNASETVVIGTDPGSADKLRVGGSIRGNNGLTITSGTSAIQALTCTTLNASSLVTATNYSINGLSKIDVKNTTNTFAGATTISNTATLGGGMYHISATDGGTRQFVEIVVAGAFGITSTIGTVSTGAPGARTYTVSGGALQLAIVGGISYIVTCTQISTS